MKIEPYVNFYYLAIIDDMIHILDNSEPGKRRWTLDEVTGLPNYSTTTRSTFPLWSKFFFVKTPYSERINYYESNGLKPYMDDYYNGNSHEFKRILGRSLNGILPESPRLRSAWGLAVDGFLSETK